MSENVLVVDPGSGRAEFGPYCGQPLLGLVREFMKDSDQISLPDDLNPGNFFCLGQIDRITSYNVCYTKLLRNSFLLVSIEI